MSHKLNIRFRLQYLQVWINSSLLAVLKILGLPEPSRKCKSDPHRRDPGRGTVLAKYQEGVLQAAESGSIKSLDFFPCSGRI